MGKFDEIINSTTPTLVDFYATWCGPCKMMNPLLEQVQAQSGLSAFKVVMDETNNTPDIVDRNILYGQIFLQPTRTAEFIVLDFTIQATGASFPG